MKLQMIKCEAREKMRENYRYSYLKERYYHEDIGSYYSYAIKINNYVKQSISILPDISPDEEIVKKIVRICNEIQLEPEYIDEVFEQFV